MESARYPYYSQRSARDRPTDALEPDEAWKARLHTQIKRELLPMVKAARAERNTQFAAAMAEIERLAEGQFNFELERERQERRRQAEEAADKWRAAAVREQQAILVIIDREKSAREARCPLFQALAGGVSLPMGLGLGIDGHRQGAFMKKKSGEILRMKAEVTKKEREARVREEAARRLEAELKRKDEEARQKAWEMQKHELELRHREESLNLRDAMLLQQEEFRLRENKRRLAKAQTRRRWLACFTS
jgi:hypothetical protein